MTEPAPDSLIDCDVSIRYWNSVPATVDGMLGGYAQISNVDLRGSSAFLAKVRRLIPSIGSSGSAGKMKLGVDCGAGIGRVTGGFLSKVCETVDVVEPVETFAEAVREKKQNSESKIGDIYVTGLQDWEPSKSYDLIWNQWCLGHLTDAQLVDYLIRCREALSKTGLVVVKENMLTDLESAGAAFDPLDSCVTRSEEKFRELFDRAGFTVVRSEEQLGFPKRLHLFPVRFFALKPAV